MGAAVQSDVRQLKAALRVQRGIPLFQEIAVVAFGFEHPCRIAAIEFDHPRCHRFQKTPIVADDEKGAGFGP